jgi:hypothetical protein
LLEVTSAAPQRVEPGSILQLTGAGFPEGRTCTVRFQGEVARPGVERERVRAETMGRAVTADRVELTADARLVASLGGGGTFRGRIEVSFDARAPGARLVGHLEAASVHFVASAADRVVGARARAPAASALASFLGIVADTSPPGAAYGVRLFDVDPAGRGAAAGLAAGDVVFEVDGAVVESATDLVAVPGATRSIWTVAREGEATPVRVVVPLAGLGGTPEPGWRVATWMVTAGVALALLLLSPLGAPWHRVGRHIARAAAAPGRAEDAGLAMAATVATAAASIAAWRVPALDVVVLALAATSVAAVVTCRRVVAVLLREALGWAALGPMLLAEGTAQLGALAQGRGLDPGSWGALRGPAAALSAVTWAMAVLGGPMRAAPSTNPLGRGTLVARRAHHVLWTVVGVAVFGPGLGVPPGSGWASRVAADTVAAAVAFSMSYGSSRFVRAGEDVGGVPRWTLWSGALGSVAAWVLTAALAPGPTAAALAAQATWVAAAVGIAFVAVVARVSPAHPAVRGALRGVPTRRVPPADAAPQPSAPG